MYGLSLGIKASGLPIDCNALGIKAGAVTIDCCAPGIKVSGVTVYCKCAGYQCQRHDYPLQVHWVSMPTACLSMESALGIKVSRVPIATQQRTYPLQAHWVSKPVAWVSTANELTVSAADSRYHS